MNIIDHIRFPLLQVFKTANLQPACIYLGRKEMAEVVRLQEEMLQNNGPPIYEVADKGLFLWGRPVLAVDVDSHIGIAIDPESMADIDHG